MQLKMLLTNHNKETLLKICENIKKKQQTNGKESPQIAKEANVKLLKKTKSHTYTDRHTHNQYQLKRAMWASEKAVPARTRWTKLGTLFFLSNQAVAIVSSQWSKSSKTLNRYTAVIDVIASPRGTFVIRPDQFSEDYGEENRRYWWKFPFFSSSSPPPTQKKKQNIRTSLDERRL